MGGVPLLEGVRVAEGPLVAAGADHMEAEAPAAMVPAAAAAVAAVASKRKLKGSKSAK